MSSLLSRLTRRSSQRLPSYAPSDAPNRRTPFSKITHVATLLGSGYCTASLIGHYLINFSGSEGDSMVPTIPGSHSISIHSPLYRHGKDIKLGDIVHAKNPIQARSLVGKRVIGLPGDYVVKDENQAPTVGGVKVTGIWNGEGEREEPMMVQVPEGHVWLAGDNMSRSRDSRFYGAVPLAMIESKVLYNGDGVFNWHSFREEQVTPAEMLEEEDLEVKTVKTSNNGLD